MTAVLEDIPVPVDAHTARVYRGWSAEERERIGRFVAEQVRRRAAEDLVHVMREMGREAKANGLTPEILQEILNER